MKKALIFDMDGVLIDSEIVYLRDLMEYAREKRPDIREEELYPMVGASKEDAWGVLARAVGNGQGWQKVREDYKARGEVSDRVDYRAIFRQEAVGLLELAKARGYRLALASSTQMSLILRVLEENRIHPYFEVVVSGEQFERSKPDPEIYHHTAKCLGVAEADCLVVEDSTFGVRAAHAAGMQVIALEDSRFGFDQSLAHHRVRTLSQVARYL